MNTLTKTCSNCGVVLAVAAFPKNASRCKPCKKLYMTQWKKDNAERISQYQKEWFAKRPTYRAEWLAKNPDYFNTRWWANRDALVAYQRARAAAFVAADPEYRKKLYAADAVTNKVRVSAYAKANREKVNNRQRAYRAKYPERLYASLRKRHTGVLRSGRKTELDVLVLEEAAILRRCRTTMTGVKWHVDHIEPLHGSTVSGLHNAFNLAVIPAALNLKKANKQIDVPWTQMEWSK